MSEREPTKIAFISEIPTPYRLPVYQQLSQEPGMKCRFYFCSQWQADRAWPAEAFHLLDKVILRGWQFERKGKNTHTWFFNPEIMRYLWRESYDLVVIAGWRQCTMLLALLVCWLKGIPYILHSESHDLKPRSWWKRRLQYVYPGIFIRKAKGCLVTGKRAATHLLSMGAKSEHIQIFPNTIDVENYQKEAVRLSRKKSLLREELHLPGQYNFLFVGRLVKIKGCEVLLDSFSRIATACPAWGLVMIGDGPMRNEINNYILHQSWRERTLMLPYVDPIDLVRYYVASDVFVLPSLEEPWAVVVNEAMTAQLPLLLSNQVGAAYDLLEDGVNGFLHTAGDSQTLSQQLLQLSSNDEMRQQFGQQSARIIQGWGYSKNMTAFRNLVATILRLE